MSGDFADTRRDFLMGAEDLLRRAAAAERRARTAIAAAAQDFSVPDSLRLEEATRNGMTALLAQWIGAAERQLADFATPGAGATFPLLCAAGLLNDWALTEALIGQVRQDQLAKALPHQAPRDPAQPSLLSRFVDHPAAPIAEAARDLLYAASCSEDPEAGGRRAPRHLQARLLWWVAAAMREQAGSRADIAFDEALCTAVRAALVVLDASSRGAVEPVAMRFAAAVGASLHPVPYLLLEALRDRRLVLFLAILAHAARIDYADARALVLDREPDRLLLALHAVGVERDGMAQIGFLLCDADRHRDVAVLADRLDAVVALDRADAATVLAALRLDPAYHAARAAIRRGAMTGWVEGAR